MKRTCAKAPCKSCPYRRDVPSGVWAPQEYEKLPRYDGAIADQAMAGATAVFMCHQQDGQLCAGWVGTHGADNLLALRIGARHVHPSVWRYESPVPLFASGAQAAEHGMREVDCPGQDAERVMGRLLRNGGVVTRRRDRAYYVAMGRRAWMEGDTRPPPNGWQGVAWKEGFDAAYERERPSLDIDADAAS